MCVKGKGKVTWVPGLLSVSPSVRPSVRVCHMGLLGLLSRLGISDGCRLFMCSTAASMAMAILHRGLGTTSAVKSEWLLNERGEDRYMVLS